MARGPSSSCSLEEASSCLEARGAAQIAHPGGTLLEHLGRTADLLATWWAPQPLLLAGLCHAAYGTDGYDQPLVDVTARSELADLIGSGAEELVENDWTQMVPLFDRCERLVSRPAWETCREVRASGAVTAVVRTGQADAAAGTATPT